MVEDANSPERVSNLYTASNAIDGTLVAPGEVFSANSILAGLDYNEASVFSGGKVESADGGGLCQIASTLYMAANWAGLDILERHPHYAKLNYIRPGFDSTLWFGLSGGRELDMQFRNTTSGYLLVRSTSATGTSTRRSTASPRVNRWICPPRRSAAARTRRPGPPTRRSRTRAAEKSSRAGRCTPTPTRL